MLSATSFFEEDAFQLVDVLLCKLLVAPQLLQGDVTAVLAEGNA